MNAYLALSPTPNPGFDLTGSYGRTTDIDASTDASLRFEASLTYQFARIFGHIRSVDSSGPVSIFRLRIYELECFGHFSLTIRQGVRELEQKLQQSLCTVPGGSAAMLGI